MATNYGEIFCQATEQLIQTALAGQKYDITKDCTVVAIPKKQDGLYSVSDGSVTFDAYAAAGTSYVKGDQVLVTIPQGDWNKQKTIINKIVTETSGGINYTSPLSTFIKGTDNLITNYNTSIQANGKTELGKDIYFTPLYTIECDSSVYVGFKSFAIAGEFMTALDGLGLTSGEYGIKILIYSDTKDAAVADLMWSSSDMLGNPYSFNSYFKQEAVFSIPSSIDTITKIELCLYQNGQFGDGTEIFNDFPQGIHNIFVKNLELYLGFEGGSINNNSISISASNLNYTTTDTVRHLLLRWFYRSEDGEFASVNTFYDPDIYEVRWYQYESGTTNKDEYGGNNWKWLNKNGEPNLSHSDYPFVLPVKMLPSRNSEKFKAIGLVKTHPLLNDPDYVSITSFESDVLTFTFTKTNNEDESSTDTPSENTPADIIRSAFSLNFDDGSYGNYYLYDQNGILLRPADEGSARERSVTIFAYDSELDDKYELYDYIDWIKWEVPGDHSMISYAKSQAFENPNENLINTLDTAIEYSSFGSFDFFITINNETEATKVRINVYTADGSNNWENNSPYTYITSIGEGMNVIANVFTINRSYQQIKINAVLLDESGNKISDSIDYSDLLFKPVSTLHSYTVQPVRNADGTVSIDNKFLYSIANNWNQDRMHNTIKCTVSIAGVEVILAETLRFGKQGTSGTGYTFLLEMLEGYNALIPGQTTQIEAILLNQNGKQIYFPNEQPEEGKEVDYKKIQWDILGYDDKGEVPITWTATERQEIISLTVNAGVSLTSNYCILQASYEYEGTDEASGKSPTLYAYLPLAIKHQDIISMSGAQQVIYGHMGTPTYSKAQYTLFDKNNNELTDGWYINNPPINIHQNPNALTLKNGCLSAAAMYSKGTDDGFIYDRYCVYYKDEQDQILWSQPILIMQSAYDYAMLNSWDGNLTIDENNGTILSTMLGAGSKNNENQFSGVLIGDVAEGTDLNSAPQYTGVYGFKDGVMSFGFRDNGTAFIGESGRGQILFDGNKGQITSPTLTYDEKGNATAITPGIAIDLDDASILISGESNRDNTRKLFEVCLDNNPLIHVSDDEYYLKSAEFEEDGSGNGFKIDLATGTIRANNFTLTDYDNCNVLYLNDKTYYLQSHAFSDEKKQGTQINLNTGSIKSYDFDLQSITNSGDYAGSSLRLDSGDEGNNIGPSMTVNMVKNNKSLKLFDVSTDRFMIHSPTWETGTIPVTVSRPDKIRYNSGWNFRKGPSTSYASMGIVSDNFYSETLAVSDNKQWHKVIYKNVEGWIWYEAAHPEDTQPGATYIENRPFGKGIEFNIGEGYFLGYNNADSSNAIIIDTRDQEYGLQLGPKDNYNLKLGWDGSLKGGTTFKWSIDSDGLATFDSLTANGGTINDMDINRAEIGSARVGSISLSGSTIKYYSSDTKNWSLSADGIKINGTECKPANLSVPVFSFVPASGNDGIRVVTSIKSFDTEDKPCDILNSDGTKTGTYINVPVLKTIYWSYYRMKHKNYTATLMGVVGENGSIDITPGDPAS